MKRSLFRISLVFGAFFLLFDSAVTEAKKLRSQFFTVTAYYSPLPHQSFYVTGNYDAEIRLNGRGIAGADGTKVFPGMIAAPKNYPFGTKICLETLGCGAIHDRGGAIVNKGERSLARHDRLDIWMGYGEPGLLRALNFNYKHLEGVVYSPDSDIKSTIYFKDSMSLEQILPNLPARKEFTQNLSFGDKGSFVEALQKHLIELSILKGSVTGVYDVKTKQAVFDFQRKHFVVQSENSVGAGNFGPKTRNMLTDVLYKAARQKSIEEKWSEMHFDKPLNKGNRNSAVFELQEILIKTEFLDHAPSGYFGKITKSALIDFQLAHNLISNRYQNGAGKVGPKTREVLNGYVATQKMLSKKERDKILAFKKEQKKLNHLAGIGSNLELVMK